MPQNIFEIYDGRMGFWQWDTGQKLIVSDNTVDEVHFTSASMSCALTKTVYVDDEGLRVCDVPDIILQDSKQFLVYAYDRESDYSRTVASAKFAVRGRPVPEEYSYDENDDRIVDLLNGLAAVEHALERGAVVKRFNTLRDAEMWAEQSQEIGLLINVQVDEKWIPYVVDSDHSISRVDDDADMQEEIKQLKQLLGSESVEKQISDAIANLNLEDTYAVKLHTHEVNDVRGLKDVVSNSHSHDNTSELNKIVDGDVYRWNATFENAKSYADGLNNTMSSRVAVLEGKIDGNDSITTQITSAVSAEKNRAEAVENAISSRLSDVEKDYLKSADKAALESKIQSNTDAIELLTNGVDSTTIDGVNDLIKYVNDHGAEVTGIKADVKANADAIAAANNTVNDVITSLENHTNEADRKFESKDSAVKKLADAKAYADEKFAAVPPVPTKLSELNNDIGYITADDIPEGSVSAAIIDVIELPTEDINENAFYRLLTGTFVFNRVEYNNWTVKCVNELPSEGEPVFSGDLTDPDSVIVTAYYNVTDNEVYGYVTDSLAAMFGVPANWYPISVLMSAVGFSFAGVIYNIFDAPMDERFRLLLSAELYYYKDSWVSMKPIGRSGTGISSEIFNTVVNVASGMFSHAEGMSAKAIGDYSHAEGDHTLAEGNISHVEGSETYAEGYASHAEGGNTSALGRYSHAEGDSTTASGTNSHAEGGNVIADGFASHAEGYGTIAKGSSQHVQGECNIIDPDANPDTPDQRGKYVHIVGNGSDKNNRSNAHTLDWDGNAWFAGDIYVGGTGQDDQNAVNITVLIRDVSAALDELHNYAQGLIDGGAVE